MKRLVQLDDYKNVLPYASELFGVYQPLLGWRSQRSKARFTAGFSERQSRAVAALVDRYRPVIRARRGGFEVGDIAPGVPVEQERGAIVTSILRKELPRDPTDDDIRAIVTRERLQSILGNDVRARVTKAEGVADPALETHGGLPMALLSGLARESMTAGALAQLSEAERFDEIRTMLAPVRATALESLVVALSAQDPFETLDPKHDLPRVGLSPVGIVHLFREYFFELDTFLGSPVGHVWVASGSTVELVEINTRRDLVERTDELSLETTMSTESTLTTQDELSQQIKKSNRDELKFGASATVSESGVFVSAQETASFDYTTTQETAREKSHKHTRQQSDKVATQLKQNQKTTFKTVTETTETSSKRYVLTNSTPDLINYELRRKMRQVGVQVQDIGSYLCWQTYVDDAGEFLGVAKLMHIAATPKLDDIKQPELIVPPKPRTEDIMVTIPYVGEDDENDILYRRGTEVDVGWGENTDNIQWQFSQVAHAAQVGDKLSHVTCDTTGLDAEISATDFKQDATEPTKWTYLLQLETVNFGDRDSISVKVSLTWEPHVDQAAIDKENATRIAAFTAANEQAYRKEFVTAARERIEFASKITARDHDELREEERIAVYRKLVQGMLAPTSLVPTPDDRTRHVVAELLNSIFDVDKMLYFVAPEWWRPRLHHSHQELGSLVPKIENGKPAMGPDGRPMMVPSSSSSISGDMVIGWGGINEAKRDDSYYITEKSAPAKLGSSLGWLLQLDGDNSRNAFLNAPWVKAVMPIRPGKEKEALNWLKHVDGMDTLTDNDLYAGPEPELQGKTMFEVLDILAARVAQKHKDSTKVTKYGDPEAPLDDDNVVFATPVDKVYEHGFYPLQGGFKASVEKDFEVFDQWVEVVPTDQVAAVAVEYDPKTGRQI